jgi:hypothetical protein
VYTSWQCSTTQAHLSSRVSFILGWILCVALLASRHRVGIYSPPAAYVRDFGLFHGGVLTNLVLRGNQGLPNVDIRWFSAA